MSRICADLDTDVAIFQGRQLTDQGSPYVFVYATNCRARIGGRWSQAVVIATCVGADGRRELPGSAALQT